MTQTNKRLLIAILILALLPQALYFVGVPRSIWLAAVVFGLNLLVCLYGATRPGYRIAWLVYAAASVISLIFFGVVSPISLLLAFA